MNWNNIYENIIGNALGNIISDLIVGVIITIFITRFLEILTQIRNTIGMLTVIHAEIQVNKKMLEDLLSEGIAAFEKEMKRGKADALPMDDKTFEDAASFFTITSDNLLHDAFNASYSGLSTLENKVLLEKILNLYTVGYHYRIKTSLRMKQLNWALLDSIKNRLKTEIKNSDEILSEISKENKKLRKINIYIETFGRIKQLIHP